MMIEEIYPSTPRLETVGPEEPGISRPDLFDGFKEALNLGDAHEARVAMKNVITAAAVDTSTKFDPQDLLNRLDALTRAAGLTAFGKRENMFIGATQRAIDNLRSGF